MECEQNYQSVSCFACGLATIDPEVLNTEHSDKYWQTLSCYVQADNPGSYSINPGENKKMYNHR